jgi:hypothetical protein
VWCSIRLTRVNNRSVRDIWTADSQGTRLVLGMFDVCVLSSSAQRISGTNDQAAIIDDAADRATVCLLKTGSDVFAVTQDNVCFWESQYLHGPNGFYRISFIQGPALALSIVLIAVYQAPMAIAFLTTHVRPKIIQSPTSRFFTTGNFSRVTSTEA